MKRNSTLAVFTLVIVFASQVIAAPPKSQQVDVLRQQQVAKEALIDKENNRKPDVSQREQAIKDKKAKLSKKAAEVSNKRNFSLDSAVRKKQEADMARRQK
jgi:hypothetical protein